MPLIHIHGFTKTLCTNSICTNAQTNNLSLSMKMLYIFANYFSYLPLNLNDQNVLYVLPNRLCNMYNTDLDIIIIIIIKNLKIIATIHTPVHELNTMAIIHLCAALKGKSLFPVDCISPLFCYFYGLTWWLVLITWLVVRTWPPKWSWDKIFWLVDL